MASDTLAVGVLQALNEGNIQIPEQVAVFSINDVNIAKYLSPPLTTIHIDIPCICETALDLLRNRVLYGGRVTKLVFVNGIPVSGRVVEKRCSIADIFFVPFCIYCIKYKIKIGNIVKSVFASIDIIRFR